MKYFMIEGTLTTPEVSDAVLQDHMAYTQKAMDQGLIFMSSLKSDMSGGLFIMKSESLQQIEHYLAGEPFKLAGIQTYHITEFNPHYRHPSATEWFNQ